MNPYDPVFSAQNYQTLPMGFGKSLNTLIPSPWQQQIPYYMDPQTQIARANHGVGTGVSDIGAVGLQYGSELAVNLAVTAAMQSKMINPMLQGIGRGIGRGIGGSTVGLGSSVLNTGADLFGRASFGGARDEFGNVIKYGKRLDSLALAEKGAAAGARVGGFLGKWVTPTVIGFGVQEAFDEMVFDPYLQGREGANVVTDTFSNRYLRKGYGSRYSPLGVNGSYANSIGFEMSRRFNRDQSWKGGDGAKIFSTAMQNGLFSNMVLTNGDELVNKTKDISEQIKTVMRIFSLPSFQEATKMLGDVAKIGGIQTNTQMARIAQSFNLASMQTGISANQLYSTVGMQTASMYSSAGVLGTLGLRAGASAMSGFSYARSRGLLGEESYALMGGDQSAVSNASMGALRLATTQLNRMMSWEQAHMGGATGSLVGDMTRIGQGLSRDPIGMMGNMAMGGGLALSDQLSKNPMAYLQQLFNQAKVLPGSTTQSGKFKSSYLAAMMQAQGISPEQINALMTMAQVSQDPGKRAITKDQRVVDYQQSLVAGLNSTNTMYAGTTLGGLSYDANRTFRGLQNGFSFFLQGVGDVGASWGETITDLTMGKSAIGKAYRDSPIPGGAGPVTAKNLEDFLRDTGSGGSTLASTIRDSNGFGRLDRMIRYGALHPGKAPHLGKTDYSQFGQAVSRASTDANMAISTALGKRLDGVSDGEWGMLFAFARNNIKHSGSPGEMQGALMVNPAVKAIFDRNGITDKDEILTAVMSIAGSEAGNKDAAIFGISAAANAPMSRAQLATNYLKNQKSMDFITNNADYAVSAGKMASSGDFSNIIQQLSNQDAALKGQASDENEAGTTGQIDFTAFNAATMSLDTASNKMITAANRILGKPDNDGKTNALAAPDGNSKDTSAGTSPSFGQQIIDAFTDRRH